MVQLANNKVSELGSDLEAQAAAMGPAMRRRVADKSPDVALARTKRESAAQPEAEAPAMPPEVAQVLEQWREYLLREGGLDETGSAISTKALIKKAPAVKELTAEHLAYIRQLQQKKYRAEHMPTAEVIVEQDQAEAPENPSKFVKGVEYTDGIYAGRAKNGDLLFLDPSNKDYLGNDNLERVVDLGYGTRISKETAEEGLVQAESDVEEALEDAPTEEVLPTQMTRLARAKNKAEATVEKTVKNLTDAELEQLRLWLLEWDALDPQGEWIAPKAGGIDLSKAISRGDRVRVLERQQEIADTSPENAETDTEFVAGNWYPMKVEGKITKVKYLGPDTDAQYMKFVTEEGSKLKNYSFPALLHEKLALRLKPEVAEAMRFQAEE